MKLMVNEVLEVITGVQKILQHYRGRKVIDMLDDIYLRCCADTNRSEDSRTMARKVDNNHPRKPSPAKGVKKVKPALSSEQEFSDLLAALRGLGHDEAEALLRKYTVSELCDFADYNSISVQKSARKDVIIGQICNHYGFNHLNTRMQQRPDMVR